MVNKNDLTNISIHINYKELQYFLSYKIQDVCSSQIPLCLILLVFSYNLDMSV